MQFDQAALSHLAEAGFDPTCGARPLRRAIQSQVEDLAATEMLEGQIKEGDTVQVSAKDGCDHHRAVASTIKRENRPPAATAGRGRFFARDFGTGKVTPLRGPHRLGKRCGKWGI